MGTIKDNDELDGFIIPVTRKGNKWEYQIDEVWILTKRLRWKETINLNTNCVERVLQQLHRSQTGKEEWHDVEIVQVN